MKFINLLVHFLSIINGVHNPIFIHKIYITNFLKFLLRHWDFKKVTCKLLWPNFQIVLNICSMATHYLKSNECKFEIQPSNIVMCTFMSLFLFAKTYDRSFLNKHFAHYDPCFCAWLI